jgi:hypothetical protein
MAFVEYFKDLSIFEIFSFVVCVISFVMIFVDGARIISVALKNVEFVKIPRFISVNKGSSSEKKISEMAESFKDVQLPGDIPRGYRDLTIITGGNLK